MYLWNTKALAKEFKEGTVSQSERFKYFLLFIMLSGVDTYLVSPYTLLYEITVENVTSSVLAFLILTIGTIWCYTINGGRDGWEFIDRFICLGFPICVKLIVVIIGMFVVYLILGSIVFGEAFTTFRESTKWFDRAISAAIGIVFFWRLAVHLKWIASESPELPTIQVDDQTLV